VPDAGGQPFRGHVILEVSTSSARSANEREAMLAESLQFAAHTCCADVPVNIQKTCQQTMTALFTTAMTLREVDPGVFEGELDKSWTIGPKVHGGAMLALCANAARTAAQGNPVDSNRSYSQSRCRQASSRRPTRGDAAGDLDPQARPPHQRG